MLTRILTGVLICLATAAGTQPEFDAASVKPGATDFVFGVSGQMKGGPGTDDPGRVTLTQFGMKPLLMKAWDLQGDQIAGPPWIVDGIGAGSYTITATMPKDTTKAQFQSMLQDLLIERFHLKLHHETRNFPGYELVVAPGGPKLKPTTQDPNIVPAVPQGRPGPPEFSADGSIKLQPGSRTAFRWGRGAGHAQFQAKTVAELASEIGSMLNRATGMPASGPLPRVADNSGVDGKYDFALDFDCPDCGLTPAMLANMPLLAGRGGADAQPTATASDPGSGLPNIFNALEKQLGLKLVKVKDVPVDVLVIDHAEKVPTEN